MVLAESGRFEFKRCGSSLGSAGEWGAVARAVPCAGNGSVKGYEPCAAASAGTDGGGGRGGAEPTLGRASQETPTRTRVRLPQPWTFSCSPE